MSSEPTESRGMSLSFKLTLWYAFVFVAASAAWFYAVYHFIDNSIDKEWRITRSEIVSTWSGRPANGVSGFEIAHQRSVIEGSIPVDLDVASHFRHAFYRIALPIILVGLLGGWFVTARGLRPLHRLGQTVRHILATGNTHARVPVESSGGELNDFVGLFNQMLEKNDTLMRTMHESLDNVAHDLRTPMTRLRGSAEVALQNPDNAQACREALADCMEESDQVLTMLNTLMDVAEAETGAMPLELEDVYVAEAVRDAVELYEIVAEEKGVTLGMDVADEVRVRADRTRLRQILANLLDNAIKYSREGQRVAITARDMDKHIELSVSDQGAGIPPGEMGKIWDRLYRGDLSRAQRGLGLGLSFVKALVEAHGGTVQVESEVNQGSRFTVCLPKV